MVKSMVELTLRSFNGEFLKSLRIFWLCTVGDLNVAIREAYKRGFIQLVKGTQVLTNGRDTLEAAGIEDGDVLTVVFGQKADLVATCGAFAVLCNGRVLAWGHPSFGGDSSRVQHLLEGVVKVVATAGAFAALLISGMVVTWGGEVQHWVREVEDLAVKDGAFVATLATGKTLTWGRQNQPDLRRTTEEELKKMDQIYALPLGLACRWLDGSDRLWQDHLHVGVSEALPDRHPRKVKEVAVTSRAYAAILDGGEVVAWGDPKFGGDNSAVRDELRYL
eukprot:Skav200972  [mRNA]  locus=scaffold448:651069:651899:- [translate_table: standard]